jgi:hypothetical protein
LTIDSYKIIGVVMIYTLDTAACNTPIVFAPATVAREVLQNIAVLLGTVSGTVPLDRELGVSGANIARPFPASEALMIADVYSAVAEYEPRAEVRDVHAHYDESGGVQIKVEVSIYGADDDE